MTTFAERPSTTAPPNEARFAHEHTTDRAATTAARRGPRVLRTLAALVGWTVVVLVVVALAAFTLIPKVSDTRLLIINGVSMTETIPLHSVVALRPVEATQIKEGDVISFDRPDRTNIRVTHRVTKVELRDGVPYFATKGDHNVAPDPWLVRYSDGTAWRVEAHAPEIGRVLRALQTPTARLVLVAAPAMLLLTLALGSIWGGSHTRPAKHARDN